MRLSIRLLYTGSVLLLLSAQADLIVETAFADSRRSNIAKPDSESKTQPQPLLPLEEPLQADRQPLPPNSLRQRDAKKQTASVFAGLGFRGSRAETAHFDESLGAELGFGLPWGRGIDFALGVGKFLERGSNLSNLTYEALARSFLLIDGGGPYLGLGWAMQGKQFHASEASPGLFGTIGLFGGDGLYCEFDFRGSNQRLLAAIFEIGFRMRIGMESQQKGPSAGPLVKSQMNKSAGSNSVGGSRFSSNLSLVEHSDNY